MNNIIKKFEAFDSSYYSFLDTKPTYEKIAVFEKQDPNTIVYADRAVQVRFLNFTAAWQAATEQSQKEIEALKAREKVLVELLGECVDTIRNEYNEMLELYSSYPHKEYDIQCQKELLNGIEQALANVRGEVK